jgi:hypothetical protein
MKFAGRGAKAPTLELQLRFGNIGDDDHQQLLVNVDSCYVVRHG